MSDPLANDFTDIAARMRELREEPAKQPDKHPWWCEDCGIEVDGHHVTFQERHDEGSGGCGCIVHPACYACENTGWVLSDYQASHPPNFDVCPDCDNPFNRDSP